jgi:hypothetical protein
LLGGYAIGTDLNQSLTLVAALPMIAFGDAFGYHLTHLLLFLALPALIVWDLARSETRALTWLSAGFVAMSAAGAAWNFMRSGDTNSRRASWGDRRRGGESLRPHPRPLD